MASTRSSLCSEGCVRPHYASEAPLTAVPVLSLVFQILGG